MIHLYLQPKEPAYFFVRSLTNLDLKMPAYILNDGVYDKVLFNDIIYVLENLGLKVLSNTNDQGGKNRPLFKALGINTNNVVFINSAGREMVSMYDIVHEVKNLRNGELDDTERIVCNPKRTLRRTKI